MAQYPANPRKQVLGYQTTADGLVYRGSGAPSFTPTTSSDARVYIDTETGDQYLYNSGWIKMARKADALTRVDTASQVNHGFSVGDPLWYTSGSYVLALDTSTSVKVSGVVIDSFDANTFYVQRNGIINLPSHGFSRDVQLFVQPDGTYSTADTSNTLLYGHAIDDNYIQLSAQNSALAQIAESYGGTELAQVTTTKDQALDFLKRVTDTTKVARVTFTDVNVDSTTFQSREKNYDVNVNSTQGAADNYKIQLPNVLNTDSLIVTIRAQKAEDSNYDYYLEPFDSIQLIKNGRRIKRYYLNQNEVVSMESKNNEWRFKGDSTPSGYISKNRRYELGEYINGYLIEGAPPKVKTTNSVDVVTDTVFVIPLLPKTLNYKNWMPGSEDQARLGGTNVWGPAPANSFVLEENVEIDPFGYKTAEKWTKNTNTAAAIRTDQSGLVLSTGDSITISGWIKLGSEDYNNNLAMSITDVLSVLSPTSASISLDTLNKKWTYFEKTFTVASGTDERIDFTITGDSLDYIYVSRFNYTKGGRAGEYVKTKPVLDLSDPDTIYAVYKPKNGVLKTSDILWSSTDYGVNLSIASTYCENTGFCNVIQLSSDVNLETTATIGTGIGLDLNGYTINWDGTDNSIPVVYFDNTGGSAYSNDSYIKDGAIQATTEANSLLKIKEALRFKFSNVVLSGNDVTRYGITDNDTGLASLFTDLDGFTITGCDRAMYINSAHYTFVDNFQILQNGYGIWTEGGSISIKNGSFEDNDSTYVYWDVPGNFLMEHVYTEDSPSTTPSYRFDFQQGHNVTIRNCSFNGGASTPDFAINVANVRKFQVKETKFNSGSCDEILKTDDVTKWAIIDCNSNIDKLLNDVCYSTNVNHSNGYISKNGVDICGTKLAHINTDDSYIVNSKISNTTVQDTLKTQNLILDGSEGNLLKWSDSLTAIVGTNFSVFSNYDLIPSGTIGVSADSTAELFVQTTSSASTDAYLSRATLKPLVVGRTYTASFYAKKYSTAGDGMQFSFRAGGTTDFLSPEFGDTCSGQYVRYFAQFIPEATTSTFEMRFGGGTTGDSVLIANMMVNEGYFPLSHSLGGTAYQSPDPTISIPSGKTLQFNGATSLDHTYNVGTTGDTIPLTQNTYVLLGDADGVYYIDTTDYNGQARLTLSSGTSDTTTIYVVNGSSTSFSEFGVSSESVIIKGNGQFKEYQYQDGIFKLVGYSNNLYTGVAAYSDSTYSSGSPFSLSAGVKVTLPNDASGVWDAQIPIDIDSLYMASDSTITGRNGDGLNIDIEFKAKPTTASNTKLSVTIDIGGAVGELYPRDFIMTKGNGVEHYYLSSFNVYTLDTWEANGGRVKIVSDAAADVYDIRYVITRTHKAR